MNCEIMVAWNMEFQVSVLAEFQQQILCLAWLGDSLTTTVSLNILNFGTAK